MLPVRHLLQESHCGTTSLELDSSGKQLTDYLPVRDSAGMEGDYCGYIHREADETY
jgi:hypothetical protein